MGVVAAALLFNFCNISKKHVFLLNLVARMAWGCSKIDAFKEFAELSALM